MKNALKSNEWERIWVHKTFKIEIEKEGGNNSDLLQNWFPSEIWFPLFSLYKFQKSDKNCSNSCRTQGNLMKSKESASRKLLKLKYRMGNQLIKTFYKIGSSQKLGHPCLICRNSETLRELLLNHVECIEI